MCLRFMGKGLLLACLALGLAGCLAFRPPHQRPDFQLGTQAFEAQDYQTAARRLETHVSKFPDDADARLMLGLSRVKLGQLSLAVPQFKTFTQLAPADFSDRALIKQSMFAEADRLSALGQTDPSLRWIMAYLTIDPDDIDAHVRMAQTHLSRGDVRNALGFLNRLADLAPRDPRVADLFEMVSAGFH